MERNSKRHRLQATTAPHSAHLGVNPPIADQPTVFRPARTAIAAKPTNKRLRIGCAMAQEIFTIRLPLINGARLDAMKSILSP